MIFLKHVMTTFSGAMNLFIMKTISMCCALSVTFFTVETIVLSFKL